MAKKLTVMKGKTRQPGALGNRIGKTTDAGSTGNVGSGVSGGSNKPLSGGPGGGRNSVSSGGP